MGGLAEVSVVSIQKLFSKFYAGWDGKMRAGAGIERDRRNPAPMLSCRINCARDALKTASNGHCCLEKAG
jgi:hypothetical protein